MLRTARALLALVTLTSIGYFAAPSAGAATTLAIYGHRCREYDASVTNEDTLLAMKAVAKHKIPCEIDEWVTKDGVPIVIHDQYPARTITPASIKKAGVTAKTRWIDMTYAQVKLLRTKGGQPISSLHAFIVWASDHGERLDVEQKWTLPNVAHYWALTVAHHGQKLVTFYGTPHGSTCSLSDLTRLKQAGFIVGIKQSDCAVDTAAYGRFDYLAANASYITATHVKLFHSMGTQIGGKDYQATATLKAMRAAGADFDIAAHPYTAKEKMS